jgi:hypothetical protein
MDEPITEEEEEKEKEAARKPPVTKPPRMAILLFRVRVRVLDLSGKKRSNEAVIQLACVNVHSQILCQTHRFSNLADSDHLHIISQIPESVRDVSC